MKTIVLEASDPDTLIRAAEMVRGGQLVAFPTDTVYGVGCDLWAEAAIEALYEAKLRPLEMAIPVLVSSVSGLEAVACLEGHRAQVQALARLFWPGALTLVLPAQPRLPRVLLAGRDTVAVRMPGHAFALALIEQVGGAMAVTSANISGEPAPVDAAQTLQGMMGRVPLLVDGGSCQVGVASTLVDLTGSVPVLLRAGGLEASELRRALPDLA